HTLHLPSLPTRRSSDLADRITYAFRRTLARQPQPDEIQELDTLLKKETQRIADGWVSAAEVGTGTNSVPKDLPSGTTPTQLAARSEEHTSELQSRFDLV